MPGPEPLAAGHYYHIYNRGNSGEALFRQGRNYWYFLRLYAKYIQPFAETYAYCLLNNHFHLLVRIRDGPATETPSALSPSRAFANLFSTYTKAINEAYQRTGSLFEKPFHRRRVTDDSYLGTLVVYIHRNPEKHGFVSDFRRWPYSSYRAMLSSQPTRIEREIVLDWFGGLMPYQQAHAISPASELVSFPIPEDWS